jgi:hypothetical protein
MVAECISPIQGTRARIVRLDACGVPVTGVGSLIVFDGFVEVAVSPQYEDGTEYTLRNAQGDFCVNEVGDDLFQHDEVDIRFCAIDPDAVSITTGAEIIVTGSPVATGTGFWLKEGKVTSRWSFELWQADSQSCTGSQARYAYWAWPQLSAGRQQDFTVADDVIEWRIMAKSKKANLAWGAGPGAVKYISAVPANGHRGFNIVHIDPPDVTGCGAVELVA